MSEIANRYRRRAAGFTARVESAPEGSWDAPSPCDGWTARDIITHMRDSAQMFLGRIDRDIPVRDTPLEQWIATRDAVQGPLDDPQLASREFESPMGSMSFESGVDRFLNLDTLAHTWDLARAVGGDEQLDPDEVHQAFEAVKPMDELLRSPGVCGPKIDPPPDADEQTQLLCFLGRRV